MKKIFITGNVGKDPETRTMPSGDSFVTFSVGVKAGTKANPKTDWMEVTANGKLADVVTNYVRKGTKVLIEGIPSVNAYINKENVAVGTLRISASSIELLGSKNDSQDVEKSDYTDTMHTKTYGQQTVDIKAGLASDEVPF